MKVLHTVEFYHPSVGGMQEVVKQLSERLVKAGHDVTVATTRIDSRKQNTIRGVKIEEFDITGNSVKGISGEVEKYKSWICNSDFDIVTNFAAQQWATDLVLPILDKIKSKKVFVPTGFSSLYSPLFQPYYESMKNWMRKYDVNIFLSNDYRDINFARENGINNITIIPNGAGEDEFCAPVNVDIRNQFGIPEADFLILHVGSHTGLKGHREALGIFKKLGLNNSTFILVANDFGVGCKESCLRSSNLFKKMPWRIFDHKKVIVTSLNRQETIAAYKAADLFLFPSNIECSPLVLFECLASKTPFVTTDVGNSKEIINWTKAGEVLPTVKDDRGYGAAKIGESARLIEELYHHPDRRKAMADSGFIAWKNRFTWEKISSDYEELYRRLLEA